MLLLTFFVLVSFVAATLIVYLRWHFNYWRKRGVCGPQPYLLVGTLPRTSAGQCNLLEELHEIYLRYRLSQKFVGIFTARAPKLFICDPQLALQILTQHFKSFRDNESSQWTNASVEQLRLCSPFVSTGEEWKARRSELVPALTINKVKIFHIKRFCIYR
uniref:Putative cytochrome P450 28a5 n=1 Tax=Bactrocera latifrons TaxID=174628 RepID=A0A0K8VD63_BACLA